MSGPRVVPADAGPRSLGADSTSEDPLTAAVRAAVASVDDPEYPGVSIVELGMLDHVEITDDSVTVALVPTFSACPAFAAIVDDTRRAVDAVAGGRPVRVVTSTAVWSTARVTPAGRAALARDFTVAVDVEHGTLVCPRCGSTDLPETSPFGPTRCRAVHRCAACGEHVEVMRS